MTSIKLDSKTYQIPSKWDELEPHQVFSAAALLRGVPSIGQFKTKMLFMLLDAAISKIPKLKGCDYLLCIGKERHLVDARAIEDIIEGAMGWLSHKHKKPDGEYTQVLRIDLTRNPYPILPCQCNVRLCGSGDALEDITFEQWGLLQECAPDIRRDYSGTRDRIISILYRAKDEPFDASAMPKYYEYAHRAGNTYKEAVLLYYWGSVNALAGAFPAVFSGTGEAYGGGAYALHMRSVYALAKGDITRFPDVQKAKLLDVLIAIDNDIKENDKLKDKGDAL